jgi:hypothetical protein
MEAKNVAISFFVHLFYYWAHDVEDYTVENGQTEERLVIKRINQHSVTISRHPIGASEEWIQQMGKYEDCPEWRHIDIHI